MGATGESGVRRELAVAYRRLGELGLVNLSSGNLSARVPGGMVISAGGATPEEAGPASFVTVSGDGTWEPGRRPSSEWRMHLAVYRAVPSAAAVVHTHADACVALSAHRRPLPGFTYLVGLFGGPEVPCVPYRTFGTPELAEAVAGALRDRTACLLANHGAVTRGRSVAAAVEAAHRLEILCRQYLASRILGEPAVLTDAEWAEFFDQARRHGYLPEP